MNIRPAIEADKSKLEEFLVFNNGEKNRKLAHDYINCMFSNDYRRPSFVIAQDNGEIIGAAAYSEELFTVDVWGISWVSVHENYRNQGLAQKLIEACFDEIKAKVKNKITVALCTYPGKTGLYDRMNFTQGGKDHDGGLFMFKVVE